MNDSLFNALSTVINEEEKSVNLKIKMINYENPPIEQKIDNHEYLIYDLKRSLRDAEMDL